MRNYQLTTDFIRLLIISVFLQVTLSQKQQQILLCQPVNSVLQTSRNVNPIRASISPSGIREQSVKSVRPTPRVRAKPSTNKPIYDKLHKKLEALEERIKRLELSTKVQQTTQSVQEKCAIPHGAKCYNFVEKDIGMITLAEAEKRCRDKLGVLASIYDERHFKKIENYVLHWMKDNDVDDSYFILGMKYQNRALLLRNGVPAKYVRWYPSNYPLETEGQTQVMMLVSKSKSNTSGLYNTTPGASAKRALCEIHRRDAV